MPKQWKRFSGVWTQTQQSQAVGSNTWPGVVLSEIYGWGTNTYGETGVGDTQAASSPIQVGTDTDWSGKVFSVRKNQSFFVRSSGLWAAGQNSNYGDLGLSDLIDRSSPTQVGSETDWTVFSRGESSVHAVRGGKLFSWGNNTSGQLAVGDTQRRSSPVQVGALTTWTSCAGNDNAAAFIGGGKLYTAGTNDGYGLLGRNTNTGQNSSPIQVGALTDWSKITAGKQFFVAIKTDGTMWSWGRNNIGQVGNNTSGVGLNYSSPVQIGALTTWSEVSAGIDQCIALKTDGTIWGWGANGSGQVGDNSGIDRSSPVQIGALTTWTKVAGGENRSAGQVTGGSLYVWGNCSNGIVGDNLVTTGFQVSPVLVAGGAWGEWGFYNCFVAVKSETIS